MKKRYAQSVAEIIDKAFEDTGLTHTVAEQRLCYLWPEIVGPGINRYTTRRYVADGTLHVYISSGVLKGELQFMKSRLIAPLNKAVGTEVIHSVVIH